MQNSLRSNIAFYYKILQFVAKTSLSRSVKIKYLTIMIYNFKKIISIVILLIIVIGGIFYYRQNHRRTYTALPPRQEINVTIIPGWNLRQIAADWIKKGIIDSEDELYNILGKPAYNYKAHREVAPIIFDVNTSTHNYFFKDKSEYLSFEGYLLPDTYRVYADAKPEDVIRKILMNLDDKITPEMRIEIDKQGKSFFEILTMASVVEKEAPSAESMGMVADIFWRRYKQNWALQSCATVNYITGKSDPAVTDKDRAIDSLYNTYKYPGLPLGPISNPSLTAIKATIYPIENDYWYFMSGDDGEMHYAKTLEEHNSNVFRYLR